MLLSVQGPIRITAPTVLQITDLSVAQAKYSAHYLGNARQSQQAGGSYSCATTVHTMVTSLISFLTDCSHDPHLL